MTPAPIQYINDYNQEKIILIIDRILPICYYY